MPKERTVKEEGIVTESLRNAVFKVTLNKDNREILAHIAGKLRLNRIKILPGDKVIVEISPYDPRRGRILYRL